jgi:hypothetical protein
MLKEEEAEDAGCLNTRHFVNKDDALSIIAATNGTDKFRQGGETLSLSQPLSDPNATTKSKCAPHTVQTKWHPQSFSSDMHKRSTVSNE